MVTDAEIARINELYKKAKNEGLTSEEKEEQASLRGKYIASIRANLKGQLDNIQIQNTDGSIENLKEKHDAYEKNKQQH